MIVKPPVKTTKPNIGNLGGIVFKDPIKCCNVVSTFDLVPDSSFLSNPKSIKNQEENKKLDWWCDKNKTSSDFFKYKL